MSQAQRNFAYRHARAEVPASLALASAPGLLGFACAAAEAAVCGASGFSALAGSSLAAARHAASTGGFSSNINLNLDQLRQLRVLGKARMLFTYSAVGIFVINQTLAYRSGLVTHQRLLETGELPFNFHSNVNLPDDTLTLQLVTPSELVRSIRRLHNRSSAQVRIPILAPERDSKALSKSERRRNMRNLKNFVSQPSTSPAVSGSYSDSGAVYVSCGSTARTIFTSQAPKVQRVSIEASPDRVSDALEVACDVRRVCAADVIIVTAASHLRNSKISTDSLALGKQYGINIVQADVLGEVKKHIEDWLREKIKAGELQQEAQEKHKEKKQQQQQRKEENKEENEEKDHIFSENEATATTPIGEIAGPSLLETVGSIGYIARVATSYTYSTASRVATRSWEAVGDIGSDIFHTIGDILDAVIPSVGSAAVTATTLIVVDWACDDVGSARDLESLSAMLDDIPSCDVEVRGSSKSMKLTSWVPASMVAYFDWFSTPVLRPNQTAFDSEYESNNRNKPAVILGGRKFDRDSYRDAKEWKKQGHEVLLIVQDDICVTDVGGQEYADLEGIRVLNLCALRNSSIESALTRK